MREILDQQSRVLLLRWQGGDGVLHEYSTSHARLVLKLTHPDRIGFLTIVLSPCHFWSGAIGWRSMKIELATGADGDIILYDKLNALFVIAGGIGVFEHPGR